MKLYRNRIVKYQRPKSKYRQTSWENVSTHEPEQTAIQSKGCCECIIIYLPTNFSYFYRPMTKNIFYNDFCGKPHVDWFCNLGGDGY